MTEKSHGNTKIVCTLGPSTSSTEMLIKLIHAGIDVVRLNFSHGTYDEHLLTLKHVRAACEQTGEIVTLLQDLQGPKIRIGELIEAVELRAHEKFTITTNRMVGNGHMVSTTYPNLPADVGTGDTILLDDGKIRLRVLEAGDTDVVCDVVVGGLISSHKGINLPGVAVSAPSFTAKDLRDMEFGIEHDVDYVALSFVRSAEDIRALRSEIVKRSGSDRLLPIIAKIEKPQAIANIDEIIEEADGIMVARGDLGVELPPEDVPMLQKTIIKKCNSAGKPVIIATQMLESMINNPMPTRAEANDVANGVIDGADAVMLSGETSIGTYPLEAVQIMDRIIKKVESQFVNVQSFDHRFPETVEGRLDALCRAACVLAEQMKAAAIVVVTRSGQTATITSSYRPPPRIVAITDSEKILRKLNLIWGIHGKVIDDLNDNSDRALQKIQEKLISSGMIQREQYMVLLAGQPFFARGSTNFIKVEKVV